MNMARLYSQLIGLCEERNGKPRYAFSSRSKNRKPGYEVHHIIPRSMGGSDKPFNLIYLTPREHFTAHHILARLYGGNQWAAFNLMAQSTDKHSRNQRITSRQHESIRQQLAAFISERMKGHKYGVGRVLSEVSRAKMSRSRIGNTNAQNRVFSDDSKAKMSAAKKGKSLDLTHIANISAAMKGKPKPRTTCQHCGKDCPNHLFARFHGANCKSLTSL